MIVWKTIKPSKLKQKEFRLSALNRMRKVGVKVRADFEKTTATWEHDVKFDQAISLSKKDGGPTLLVDTGDEIYGYVSEGTKAHTISPRPGGVLAFKPDYYAKTMPGVISSMAGGSFGKTVITSRSVRHPGTEARRFNRIIANKWRAPFKREMEAALRDARKKCGHAI